MQLIVTMFTIGLIVGIVGTMSWLAVPQAKREKVAAWLGMGKNAAALALALLAAVLLVPGRMMAQSLSLDIDMQPLFDSINTYLPIFFSILAIAGGITIAVIIVKFVINAIVDGFQGRRL